MEEEVESVTKRQKKILASYDLHESMEPDISTERLLAMVENDTGADSAEVIEALMADERGELT